MSNLTNSHLKAALNGLHTFDLGLVQQAVGKLVNNPQLLNARYPSIGRNLSLNNRQTLGAIHMQNLPRIQGRNLNRIRRNMQAVLHRNQPGVGWNRYVPGQHQTPAAINAALRRLVNSVRSGNAAQQQRAWLNLNYTRTANNRRYPTLSQYLQTTQAARNWMNSSRSGRQTTRNNATANLLISGLAHNHPEVWGAPQAPQAPNAGAARGPNGGNTVADFNRAPRNRATFNRFARQWFNANTTTRRLMPSLVSNFNGNQNKKNLMMNLMHELTGNPYTISSFKRIPDEQKNRNTLNTYANKWLGVNIRVRPNAPRNFRRYIHVMREIHPDRQPRNNANRQAKATLLTTLAGQLKNRGVLV
jgi:hypothetical protein